MIKWLVIKWSCTLIIEPVDEKLRRYTSEHVCGKISLLMVEQLIDVITLHRVIGFNMIKYHWRAFQKSRNNDIRWNNIHRCSTLLKDLRTSFIVYELPSLATSSLQQASQWITFQIMDINLKSNLLLFILCNTDQCLIWRPCPNFLPKDIAI